MTHVAPPDHVPDPNQQPGSLPHSSTWSRSRILHYGIAGVLVIAGLAYWALKPPSLNPMADPRAANALALVQTHPAQQAPTVLQAMTDHVKRVKERGQGARLGEWQVNQEGGEWYVVRVRLREEGTDQWFEREFVWRVNLASKTVEAVTLPATGVMPVQLEEPTPSGQMDS
ncbi:MAG: hypothetical protein ACREI3_02040 [Nitrospirales bacterium]